MQSIQSESLLCLQCGYDLRAISSERCPECGSAIDREAMRQSQLPWAHRRQIGRWKAYRRTLGVVLFAPKKFAAEIARPASYRDAQVFRWITIFFAMVPLAAVVVIRRNWWDGFYVRDILGQVFSYANFYESLDQPWGFVVVIAAIFVALVALTGMPSYFFHPRLAPVAYQNHAVALSYYPCGLLAPCAFLLACAWAGQIALEQLSWFLSFQRGVLMFAEWIAAPAAVILLIAYFVRTLGFLRRVPHCGVFRPLAAEIIMVISPLVAAIVVLFLPLAVQRIWPAIRW